MLSINQFDFDESDDYATYNTQIFLGISDKFKMGVYQLIKLKNKYNFNNKIISVGNNYDNPNVNITFKL